MAIDVGVDPAFHGDVERLAKALSGSNDTQTVFEYSRQAARAQLDLIRIRKIRAWLFETRYFVGHAPAPDRLEELNVELAKLERYERRAFSKRKSALRLWRLMMDIGSGRRALGRAHKALAGIA